MGERGGFKRMKKEGDIVIHRRESKPGGRALRVVSLSLILGLSWLRGLYPWIINGKGDVHDRSC